MLLRFVVENILAAAAFCALGILFLRAGENNIVKLEKLTRNRTAGMIMGWAALIMCVPHAVVISPDFLLPLLWPLALIIPVLCFFYVDYCTARAFAGLVIIYAYDLVHFAYEQKLPLAAAVTVIAWLTGIAGIWVSGRPCALRDWFRFAAKSRRRAVVCGILSFIPALCAIYTLAVSLL